MSRLGALLLAGPAFAAALGALAAAGVVSATVATAGGVAVIAAIGVVVGVGAARPGSQVFGPAIVRADTGRPEVALTFDDGPDPESTEALLAALDAVGARATFFLLADRAEAFPDLARAVARRHEVGLHGATHHPWLTVRAPERGAAELTGAAERLAAITGVRPSLFRPPFGATSPRLAEAARQAGLTVAWCSVRTGDGGPMTPQALRAACATAGAGDVVLLHEGPRAAREALPHVLSDLAARGLRSVTLSDLLARSPA